MADTTTQLRLQIGAGPDVNAADLQDLTLSLRQELFDLNELESVDLVRGGKVPERAKPGDPITWGELLMALVASGGVLTTLIGLLQHWLTRHERSGVTIEIGGDKLQLSGVTSEQQQRIIDEWIARRSMTVA